MVPLPGTSRPRTGGREDGVVTTSVRPATPDDARAVARIHVAGWREGYRGLLPDAHLDALDVEEEVVGWTRALTGGVDALVAHDGDDVLGFATLGPTRDDDLPDATGEVYALYVRPGTWRRGVGSALLDAALDHLRTRGRDAAGLWTLATNVRARTFYEAHGWHVDGAEKVEERPGLVLHEVRYRFP